MWFLNKMNSIIIRYSEIALKGKNRRMFENQLVENIHFYLKKNNIEYEKVIRHHARIIILTNEKPNMKPVFGIITYSYAKSIDYDEELLKEEMLGLSNDIKPGESFRVSVQRIDKNMGKKSVDMEREIGELIFNKTKNPVSLKNPDRNFEIELMNGKAFLFDNRIKAFGGLPLGTDTNSSAIIKNSNDVLATLVLMRRGVLPNPLITTGYDISLILKYINTAKKVEVLNMSEEDAYSYLKEKGIESTISGELLDDIVKKEIQEESGSSADKNQKNLNLFTLQPLVGMSVLDVECELKKYEDIY